MFLSLYLLYLLVVLTVPIVVYNQLEAWALYFFLCTAPLYLVTVLACLRTAIIGQYRETTADDGCVSCGQACICTPCVAAQVMRWTDGRFEKKYHSIATSMEMPPHEKAQQYVDQAKATNANVIEERGHDEVA